MIRLGISMFVWFLLLGAAISAPTDEFQEFTSDGGMSSKYPLPRDRLVVTIVNHLQKNEAVLKCLVAAQLSFKNDKFLMGILPSGYSSVKVDKQNEVELSDIIDKDNEYYEIFNSYVRQGVTAKGLTFTIYDDSMREATVALYRLFQKVDKDDFDKVKKWALNNINKDMCMYALHLTSLFNKKREIELEPPFIWKPSHFVNAETIVKALRVNGYDINERVKLPEASINQFNAKDNVISINSNYSGWNMPKNGVDKGLDYFREDIGLNTYYYGVHLMHPFWMSNEELEDMDPRHAERYYFTHQQLLARYSLEKEHLRYLNVSEDGDDESIYVPYLMHDNGLAFPTRSCVRKVGWDDEKAVLKSIDIAIKECINRGLLVMDNGTTFSMTDDSHIGLLAKLIRANLDGIKMAKIVRSVFGYGSNRYPIDQYNPAPSLLHFPETSLRDPVYWYLVQYMLNYFTEYKKTMKPYDLSAYETEEFKVLDKNFTALVTYYDYYQFNINKAVTNNNLPNSKIPTIITARQRRLKHLPFTLSFDVDSQTNREVIIRIFLGPECEGSCWTEFNKFFEIDAYIYPLGYGLNTVNWSSDKSKRFAIDDEFNMEVSKSKKGRYNMFRFPENLLVPKGLDEGLNLTLFVMVTPAEDFYEMEYPQSLYTQMTNEIDMKPLGFPFHRQATGFKDNAPNYRFYSICVYHHHRSIDASGQFSPHLY